MKRVIAYYDGSNFYHYARSSFGVTSVDFKMMSEQLLDDAEALVQVRYFSAPVNQQEDPEGYKRQQRFFANLRKTPLVELNLGKLVKRPLNRIHISCPVCGHQEAEELRCPVCNRIIPITQCFKLTEKGVDVHLGMTMLLDAIDDRYDVALLFSSDADFSPTIRYITKKLGKAVVYCKFPGKTTSELLKVCSEWRDITRADVENARPFSS